MTGLTRQRKIGLACAAAAVMLFAGASTAKADGWHGRHHRYSYYSRGYDCGPRYYAPRYYRGCDSGYRGGFSFGFGYNRYPSYRSYGYRSCGPRYSYYRGGRGCRW